MNRMLMIGILCLFALAACESGVTVDIESLPAGDATDGASLFDKSIHGAPACSSCHQLNAETLTGPGMAGFAERAEARVEGETAAEYTLNSILHPSQFVVSGFSNLMYAGYSRKLSEQNLADLIAFLFAQ